MSRLRFSLYAAMLAFIPVAVFSFFLSIGNSSWVSLLSRFLLVYFVSAVAAATAAALFYGSVRKKYSSGRMPWPHGIYIVLLAYLFAAFVLAGLLALFGGMRLQGVSDFLKMWYTAFFGGFAYSFYISVPAGMMLIFRYCQSRDPVINPRQQQAYKTARILAFVATGMFLLFILLVY